MRSIHQLELSLDGDWQLWYGPSSSESDLQACIEQGYGTVPARVPGNVELDLERAGLLEDLFYSENLRQIWPLEGFDWWYTRTFDMPSGAEADGPWELVFDGLDCLAEIWLNGALIATTANALITHRIAASGLAGKENTISVRIRSAIAHAATKSYAALDQFNEHRYEGAWLRKPPAAFGWDIAPRTVSAGIWRSLTLRRREVVELSQVHIRTESINGDGSATLQAFVELRGWCPGLKPVLRIEGVPRGGGQSFVDEVEVAFSATRLSLHVSDAQLWWPRGYGVAALYDVTVTLIHGDQVWSSVLVPLGIRTVDVDRGLSNWSRLTPEVGGDFRVRVNGLEVFLSGTNWVPLDAFHSRDIERLPHALNLLDDVGGNIVRCWGGNVYEADEFYDWCDEHGVLVWQDFALACGIYPQVQEFAEVMRAEAVSIVQRLRQHPSLFLWAGNNEGDQVWDRGRIDPNNDWISRVVLRDVVLRHDPSRAYLASSPFYSSANFERGEPLPEEHLWGPRADYRASFYVNHGAAFVSEIGYHGCPALDSLKRFLPPERLAPDPADSAWLFHSTLQTAEGVTRNYNRVELMINQARMLFPELSPVGDERLILASQLSQAEAKKFFVESARLSTRQSGVIWWNLLDGWPQISDAVVDYYFAKKLAYFYLRASQQPVTVVASEASGWGREVVLLNHSGSDQRVDVRVTDAESGRELWSGSASAAAGGRSVVTQLPLSLDGPRCLLFDFVANDGQPGSNHYVERSGPLSLAAYDSWLPAIGERYGFSLSAVGLEAPG